MKSICFTLCLVALGFFNSPTSGTYAVDVAYDAPVPMPPTYEGSVMMAGDNMLMIRTAPDQDALTFHVPKDSKITRNGERAALEALQDGDLVTVVAAKQERELVATVITARTPY
jgi:hypothetical protein